MSGKIKHPRAKALEVAREITPTLQSACEPGRFIFAGSLRRRKAEVGDIEVVYVPKFSGQPDPTDLFGKTIAINEVDKILDGWLAAGTFAKRPGAESGRFAWGEHNKLALHTASGIGVDFFQATADSYFSLLVCRTGPAQFNTRLCMEAEKRGLLWNFYRGLQDRETGELMFVPRSEKDLFDYFRWPYLEPWERK